MIRNSKQRQAILNVLKGTRSHPTADWIYEQVRKEIPNISLGTVYRNLKLMKEEGGILNLEIGSLNRFDGNSQNHYHFMCEKCGRVFDIDEPIDAEIDERVAHKTSFLVRYHRLEFHGLCLDCQTNSIAKEV
jgi:Fe2+ or Zn2+ uptake regulation protein